MKNIPPRARQTMQAASLPEQAARQEEATSDLEAGTGPRAHRRTTVTVERETISFVVRRSAETPSVGSAAQPAGVEAALELPDKILPAALPAWKETSGGKP